MKSQPSESKVMNERPPGLSPVLEPSPPSAARSCCSCPRCCIRSAAIRTPRAAFAEYAADSFWVWRHLGQFAGFTVLGMEKWCREEGEWDLEVVERNPEAEGFEVLAKRWIVERTFSWLGRSRQLSKDYERRVQTSETMIIAGSDPLEAAYLQIVVLYMPLGSASAAILAGLLSYRFFTRRHQLRVGKKPTARHRSASSGGWICRRRPTVGSR